MNVGSAAKFIAIMSFMPYYSLKPDERKQDEAAVPLVDNKILIKCVQMYEMLYVGNHPKYSDSRYKEEIWEKIACSMGIPVSLCKRSWFNLRDSYRRALRKRRDAFVDGLPYRKWRYEDEMEFLAPYISIRDPGDRTDLNTIFLPAIDPLSIDPPNSNAGESQPKEDSATANNEPKSKRKRDKNMPAKQNYQPRNLQMDHIDAFLVGVGATLKNFTPRNQNIAKAKIFSLVSEMEMQQITEYKDQWKNMPQSATAGGNDDEANVVKLDDNEEENDGEENMAAKYPTVCIEEKENPNKSNNIEGAQENANETIASGDRTECSPVPNNYEMQFCQYSASQ